MAHRLDQLASIAKTLSSESPATRSEEWLRQHLRAFLQGYMPLMIATSPGKSWHRARKCPSSDGFSNLRETLYPPPEVCTYGRANLPGSASLYASSNIVTAVEEVRPKPGEIIQVTSLRLLPGATYPCHVLGELERITNGGASLVHSRNMEELIKATYLKGITLDHLAHVYVDAFLAAWFRRRVDHPNEYKGTAVCAEMLHGLGSGLIYPSVPNNGAINVAIPVQAFDLNFEVF